MKKTIYIRTRKKGDQPQENDFEKTGVSSFSLNLNFTVTQRDMEEDLVKKTEGKFLTKDDFNENTN